MRSGTCHRPSARSVARHFGEMVLAMLAGMLTLYPAWTLVAGSGGIGWPERVEVDTLAMATAMALPMSGWMLYRGHRTAAVVEMSAAMYAGFLVFLPLFWAGAITPATLLTLGHVAMLLLMLVVTLRHPPAHHRRPAASTARSPRTAPAAPAAPDK